MIQENNYDYLAKQLKYTGFGEDIAGELRNKMEEGHPAFTLAHTAAYGRDEAKAELQFRKSDTSEMYFFNNYKLEVAKGNNTEAMSQTFYINSKEDNVTLKEGYNLLQGRAIHKEFIPKEAEKYNAWMQLDFKNIDENGNYAQKKFHQNYGYDLAATLKGYPITEMAEEGKRQRLIESLERGNRQSVSYVQNGAEQKVYIEAAPQFKSLNFYDENQRRIRPEQIGLNPAEKQEEQNNKVSQQQKEKTQTVANGSNKPRTKKQGLT